MTPEQAKEINDRFKSVYKEKKTHYFDDNLQVFIHSQYIDIRFKDNIFSNVFTEEYYNIEDGGYSIGIGITEYGVYFNCSGRSGFEWLTDYNTIKEKIILWIKY